MNGTINIKAQSGASNKDGTLEGGDIKPAIGKDAVPPDKLLRDVASTVGSHRDALFFSGGIMALCIVIVTAACLPTLCSTLYLAFAAICLPYRVVSFAKRKWIFFIVDFCYFANLACCAFLVLAPEDARIEAAVFALCEGPLAAALIAWQCAWVFSSPDHIISVLLHLLPGLALFCHRFLAHTRRPLRLIARVGLALWGAGPSASTATSAAGASVASRLGHALELARGRVPCPVAAVATATAAGGLCPVQSVAGSSAAATFDSDPVVALRSSGSGCDLACYAQPAPVPAPCPSPVWLWLGIAPLAFYLAWQLVYFLVVQVLCRRLILAGGYDTSYRALARRAQRANNALNRLVRHGSVARRLTMFGLLQLLFTLLTQALAILTYGNFGAALLWQLVKFAVPLYLGACYQCQRLPAQQLGTAAKQLVVAGVLDARVLGPQTPQPYTITGISTACTAGGTEEPVMAGGKGAGPEPGEIGAH